MKPFQKEVTVHSSQKTWRLIPTDYRWATDVRKQSKTERLLGPTRLFLGNFSTFYIVACTFSPHAQKQVDVSEFEVSQG